MLGRTMRSTGKYFFAALLTWGITLIPAMYYAYMQVLENRIVDDYLHANGFTGAPSARKSRSGYRTRSDGIST